MITLDDGHEHLERHQASIKKAELSVSEEQGAVQLDSPFAPQGI